MGVINGKSIVKNTKKRPPTREELVEESIRDAKKKKNILHQQPKLPEENAVAKRFANIVENDPYASAEVQIKNDLSDISSIDFNDIYSGKVSLNEFQIQRFTSIRRGWPNFKDVFMVSAKSGTNVRNLRRALVELAKPGNWVFHPKVGFFSILLKKKELPTTFVKYYFKINFTLKRNKNSYQCS